MELLVEEDNPGSWSAKLLGHDTFIGTGISADAAIGDFFAQNCEKLFGTTIVAKDPACIDNIELSATSC